MDCHHWLVDFEKNKQEVQVGLCCFLRSRWKVQSEHQGWMEALCRDAGSMLFNVSDTPAAEARMAEGASWQDLN